MTSDQIAQQVRETIRTCLDGYIDPALMTTLVNRLLPLLTPDGAPQPKSEKQQLAEACQRKLALLREPLRAKARELGYAFTEHGTMARDLDFVAVPWTDEAVSPQALMDALLLVVRDMNGGIAFVRDEERNLKTGLIEPNPCTRPHGRMGWSIHLGGGPYLDISVIPPSLTPDGEGRSPKERAWDGLRELVRANIAGEKRNGINFEPETARQVGFLLDMLADPLPSGSRSAETIDAQAFESVNRADARCGYTVGGSSTTWFRAFKAALKDHGLMIAPLADAPSSPRTPTKLEKHTMDAAELLKKWDNGQLITTIEMGGLGPGYEQAIHVLVFELLRDHPTANAEEPASWGDDTVHRVSRDGQHCGFSGAQVGAAKWLAHRFITKGYQATMDECRAKDPDRTTTVSTAWPHIADPVTQ